MMDFTMHTKQSAPAKSLPLLEGAEQAFGFIPNLLGVLAEAPSALRAYLGLSRALETASLKPVERQVALLSMSFENDCHYCMAAHSAGAHRVGASDGMVEALRCGEPLPDPRLHALSTFTRAVVRTRGRVGEDEVQRFLDAGFEKAHVLEVLVAVAMKTLSNFTNHLAATEVNEVFKDFAWEKPEVAGTARIAA